MTGVIQRVSDWESTRPPNDSDAEWTPDFPAGAAAECYRQGAEKRSHRGHHDGRKRCRHPW
jgi:hypothetical protein